MTALLYVVLCAVGIILKKILLLKGYSRGEFWRNDFCYDLPDGCFPGCLIGLYSHIIHFFLCQKISKILQCNSFKSSNSRIKCQDKVESFKTDLM